MSNIGQVRTVPLRTAGGYADAFWTYNQVLNQAEYWSNGQLTLAVPDSGGLAGSAAAGARLLPFATQETTLFATENTPLAQGASIDVLNISPGVPGVVTSIWLTAAGRSTSLDAVLAVFIDGESTPSVTTDLGTLGAHNTWQAGVSFRVSTPHVTIDLAVSFNSYSYQIRFPIPFKSSIRITLTNPDALANVYTQAAYSLGISLPWKLKSSGLTFPNRLVAVSPANQNNGSVQFLSLPAGSSGFVAWHSLVYGSGTNQTFIEGNPVAYIDGQVPGTGVFPQFNSTGGEDYFRSAWAGTAGIGSTGPSIITAPGTAALFTAGLDFLDLMGGLKFSNGILMRLEQGQAPGAVASTATVDICYLVLYYVPNP